MVKIQENNKQFTLTIPRDIALDLGFKKGTEVVISTDSRGEEMIVRKRR